MKKLIRYVFEKEKLRDKHHGRKPLVMKKYLQSYDQDKWVSQFKENDNNRTFNHKRRTVLRHEIIAFAPQDNKHLTREKLQDFIRFYFKHRSSNSKAVAGVHYEKSVHIHFVLSGVGVDGRSTRVDRSAFKDFKIKLQEFQRRKYPELSHSVVDHSRPKTLKLQQMPKEQRMTKNRGVISDKEKLSKQVSKLAKGCKSLEELADKLRRAGLKPYYRYGKLTGLWISGKRKLRLTTLGVDKRHLKEMTLEQKRLDGLSNLRGKRSRNRGMER